MKRLEGISLLSALRFPGSVLLTCFFYLNIPLLTFLLMVYSILDLVLGVGERKAPCVKMFTVMLLRQIIFYTMWMVLG